MPIKPENRGSYPADWRQVSERIRFERAKGLCECTGQCDDHAGIRCMAPHGTEVRRNKISPWLWTARDDVDTESWHGFEDRPIKVVLTTAHLDHDPSNNDDGNLLAMCQRCHNRYDSEHRAATRRATRADGQGSLFQGAAPKTGE